MTNEASQNCIFAYAPQPYFVDSSDCADVSVNSPLEITNGDGLFDPDLSNAMTITSPSGGTGASFSITFEKNDSFWEDFQTQANLTIALLGCSLKVYDEISPGVPDLSTEREMPFSYRFTTSNITDTSNPDVGMGYVHNSTNLVKRYCGVEMPGVVSGGLANMIVNGIGPMAADSNGTATIDVELFSPFNSDYLTFTAGHVFIGLELPVMITPRTFTWRIGTRNNRAIARDFGTKSSSGTIVRSCSAELVQIPYFDISGSEIDYLAGQAVGAFKGDPNFYDLLKINTSYPILFSPYPVEIFDDNNVGKERFDLSGRQNFFAIYGFLEGDMEFRTDAYRDGINSEYRMGVRMRESR